MNRFLKMKNRAREALTLISAMEKREGMRGVGAAVKNKEFPEWVSRILLESQGEYWPTGVPFPTPEKWRFRFFRQAMLAVAKSDSEREATESYTREGDTIEMLAWLASDTRRMEYMDLARQHLYQKYNGRYNHKFKTELQEGHMWERFEVYNLVLSVLDEVVDNEDEVWLANLTAARGR